MIKVQNNPYMLVLLSPSKTLNFNERKIIGRAKAPVLFNDTIKLSKELKKLSSKKIMQLMDISPKLADLNYQRFQDFHNKITSANSAQAIFAFRGDVYEGFDVDSLDEAQIKKSNNKIAILSGLYGIIKPLDLIQPYRLDMGINLKNAKGRNLYQFWGDKISDEINRLEKEYVVNLASHEYFSAVNTSLLKSQLINVSFKENRNGKVSIIALFAKKARGMMARYIVENDINDKDRLKDFNVNNYKFSKSLSTENEFIFIRKHK